MSFKTSFFFGAGQRAPWRGWLETTGDAVLRMLGWFYRVPLATFLPHSTLSTQDGPWWGLKTILYQLLTWTEKDNSGLCILGRRHCTMGWRATIVLGSTISFLRWIDLEDSEKTKCNFKWDELNSFQRSTGTAEIICEDHRLTDCYAHRPQFLSIWSHLEDEKGLINVVVIAKNNTDQLCLIRP